ncbi:hypothetical protein ASG29_08005 [Sphingomonas sp. Leaf412]|uniref:FecR family protein n=1 Tax=Sphingomonas sp. Leaf412 TaxID=1736370 RepID=UPI0006F31CE5|nr:FecR domain-containing protein [Sphingomonas sp. Leaf412]KQT31836.1 hypothetical protein ASG29_08005 [Sphingomonas sp. Leaf412]
MRPEIAIDDEAIGWAVRSSEPDFDDWEGLAAWLSTDPARNAAYDRAMMGAAAAQDALVQGAVVVPLGARPSRPASGRRLLPAAGWIAGIAACAAGALLLLRPVAPVAPPPRIVDAPAGRARVVALADGTRITMAGSSRLLLDDGDTRRVTLSRGRAVFAVRHDATRRFGVTVGAHEVVDAGTVFEVAEIAGGASVAVAEGAVIVDPAGIAARLAAGEVLVLRDGDRPRRSAIPREAVGRWHAARMTYRAAPLPQVASDLAIAWGRTLSVDPVLRDRRFTGILVPAVLRDRPDELGALLDVRVRTDAAGWRLLPR